MKSKFYLSPRAIQIVYRKSPVCYRYTSSDRHIVIEQNFLLIRSNWFGNGGSGISCKQINEDNKSLKNGVIQISFCRRYENINLERGHSVSVRYK